MSYKLKKRQKEKYMREMQSIPLSVNLMNYSLAAVIFVKVLSENE